MTPTVIDFSSHALPDISLDDSPAGSLVVITGSMFSGKTEELIRRVRRALYAPPPCSSLQAGYRRSYRRNPDTVPQWSPSCGDRFSEQRRTSRSSRRGHACRRYRGVQFFDSGIVAVCQALADTGYHVIAAGLDMDYRGFPFGPMPQLLSIADEVVKLRAICTVCGAEASRSQRLINGNPAPVSDATVMIGAAESYEARCRKHHIVPPIGDAQVVQERMVL